ncbi:hypothetical protein BV22DRAFT_915578 [Leucogyrophana mollusca]|uniref:Uncharacterized protein n=1 Tax=Leucogyrophana mollusca TaxID=85980 RepID=A0ACB8AXM8_9AGAM|nr:hypothetical protein BV22DRAFT_915578 [Leucogyrophana mollusca]
MSDSEGDGDPRRAVKRSRRESLSRETHHSRSRSRSRSHSRDRHRRRSKNKDKEREKDRDREREKKRKREKERDRERRKSDKDERRSILTGKKIKLKVHKDARDHEMDANRQNLLQFLNSTFE